MTRLRLFLLLGLPLLTFSLFEDQTGTYDWRQQYIGRPEYTKILPNLNRIFIASDQNALASLNLKNGNIVWRKVFEMGQSGRINHVIWGFKEIIVVTNNGQRVQAFDYNQGFASWEYALFKNNIQDTKISSIESKNVKDSFYLTDGKALCLISSRQKNCIELPKNFEYENIFETEEGVFLIGLKDDLSKKIHYNSQLSKMVSELNLENFNKNLECVSSSNQYSCFSKDQLFILNNQINSGNFEKLYIEPLNLGADSLPRLVWSSPDSFLLETKLNEEKNLYVFKQYSKETDLVLLKKLESIQAFDVQLINNKNYLIFSKYIGNNKLNFYIIDLESAQERPEALISANVQSNEDIIELKVSLTEKNSKLSMIVSCFFSDYSLTVFNQNGVKYFTREESLAYIVGVEMIDFPLIHLQEEFEDEFGSTKQDNIFTMFYKRIRTQLVMLKELVQIDLVQKIKNLLQNNPIRSNEDSSEVTLDEITRDEFNLNKIIVSVTSVGKVFGIYTSSNGKILWSFFLKNTIPFSVNKMTNESVVPLFVQRTAAHVPYEPQCAVVTKVKDQDSTKTRIFFFNPLTGKPSKDSVKEGIILDQNTKQVFLSTFMDSHFLKPIMILDETNKIHVYPENSVSSLKTKYGNKPTIVFTGQNQNENKNSLTGYSMKLSSEKLLEVWKLNFESEKIIAIASKLSNDRIHSHGKVLGDRSVLYKYLNPNMIGVVTSGEDSQQVPFINIYLVDTVTGSIINSFNHKRCRGPVRIVHAENWFFYSYYNIKFRRHEVASVELFEGDSQFNSTHFSSFDDIKPLVFSKSFIVQRGFDSIQVTLTEKGISTKDIIVASQYGVLLEIPWILIDPRRPIKMTEVEREENLLPYMPEIPLNYEFTLNYYNYVYNIRGIITAASGLESTSLVFTYGLDIFFTRVFPSKTFDMIREDFDYFFISTLMVGLVLGTLLSKKLASSSNLKKAWK